MIKCDALDVLRSDNWEHKSADVFVQILRENPKLGDLYSAGNPNDLAFFNSLFPEDFLGLNNVKVVKRRPITWQYQG